MLFCTSWFAIVQIAKQFTDVPDSLAVQFLYMASRNSTSGVVLTLAVDKTTAGHKRSRVQPPLSSAAEIIIR